MSAWIVYSKDGRAERCVLRSLEYGGTHMGERAVTATFDSSSEVAFEVFDYIEYRGEKFELETVPTVKKTSDFNYEYELRFVSLKYELERCEMRDLVPNDNGVVYPTPLTFTFTGDVRYLVERIQACLDDLYGKGVWSIIVADGVKSEEKNISIAQQNCWNALALVSTTYGLNFYVKGRTITIGGEQSLVGHTFEYGKGNGLYEVERAADTGTGIVTKLRAYGASRNLDYSYPKKPEWSDSVLPVSFALSPLRLMLPSFKTDGKTDYVLADDATIAKYGIREASMVYDDIYPTITGATYNGQAIDEIKSVDEVDETKSTFTIELHDLGFDLEEHLTTSDAQISMKTGTLQGYTFNISGIEKLSGGYKLTLGRNSLENSEESGAYVPSKDWNMAKGDKFVLLNILMPQAYIREAENRLIARAKEYLAQYGKTNFSYNIGLHDKFLVEHPSVYDALVEGARLSVYDAELGISEDVTIQSITITENMEENILPQVKVTLNNEPSASTLDRIQGKLNDVANEVSANGFTAQSEIMSQYRKKLDKPFFEKLFVAIDKNGNEIAANDVTTPVAYILAKYDLASVGGMTMYAEGGDLDIPSIYNGLPIDNETLYWENVDGSRVLKAKGGEGGGGLTEVYWGDVKMKPTFATVATSGKYADLSGLPNLSVYATTEYLISELKKYVTLNTEQTIGAHKNFLNGLSIGGLPITKSQDDVIYLDANLVVRGGITMYSDNTVDVGSIYDGLPIDGVTIYWDGGVLKANITEGVITNITSAMVVEALGYTPYNASNPKGYISGITSDMVTSALGYTPLKDHQTIYALTIQKNGTTVGTYTPNSAKKTINIVVPTKVSELDNDEEYATTSDLDSRIDALINGAPTAFDTLKEIADVLQGNVNSIGDIITTLGTKADKAIKISAGTGLSGGGTLEADRTLSLATSGVTAGTYKSVTVDEYGRVTDGTNPTTLAGYGITDAYTKVEANALYDKYLLLTGGTLSGDLILKNATYSTNTPKIIFVRGTSTDSYHDSYITNDGGAVTFGISYSGTDYNRIRISNKSMMPISSNSYAIGTDELRFSNVYSVLGNYSGEVSMQSANVNGGKITYNSTNKYFKLEGDLLVTGGVTMYASDSSFTPSTIMNGVVVDNVTILKDTETGALMINPELVLGGGGGEVSTVAWGNVLGKPSWITDTKPIYSYSEISGAPTLLSSFNNDVGFITSSALDGYLLASNYTASDILTKLLTVDGTGSGLDADTLDGVEGDSILELKQKGTSRISAVGWYRIAKFKKPSSQSNVCRLHLSRNYNSLNNEAYIFDITYTHSNRYSITQTTGTYVSTSSQCLTKIRIDSVSSTSEYAYVDFYYSKESANHVYWLSIGSLESFRESTLVEEPIGTPIEFETAKGCKSALGFTGDLTGNASTATQLQNPRTIWGQSFDGTGNIDGAFTLLDTARDSRPFYIEWLLYNERVALNMWSYSSSLGGFGDMCLGISSDVVSQGSLYFNSSTKQWGVGTASPEYKFEVNGNIASRATTNVARKYIVENSVAKSSFYAATSGRVGIFEELLGQWLIVNNGGNTGLAIGNVGIGTLSPTYKLEVRGDIYSSTNIRTPIATIDGIPIYKSQDDVLYIDGNLAVRGGITMYATDAIDVPSIIDALPIASSSAKGIASFNPNDFSVVDGYVSFIGGGGVDESVLADYAKKTDLSKYLSLSGGELSNTGYVLTINRLENEPSWLQFKSNWEIQGSIGAYNNSLLWMDKSFNTHTILHSGNWSQFITAADGGNYLPLSGGTLNGSLSNVLVVKSTGDYSGWKTPIQVLTPGIQTGGHVNIEIGKSSTTRNIAWFGFKYYGDGSNENLLTMGLHSVDDALVINGNGYVGINNISPDYQLHIISDYHQVARFQSNTQSEASIAFRNSTGLSYVSGMKNSSYFVWSEQTNMYVIQIDSSGNGLFSGGITMYSDIRKKTKLQDVELTLQQVANAPLIEHYYNSDEKRTTHVGSIAQYWAEIIGNDWFCKLDGEGYYTMEIQNAALASAISIARELVKYESKTDRKIRLLKQRVKELEDKIEKLENN